FAEEAGEARQDQGDQQARKQEHENPPGEPGDRKNQNEEAREPHSLNHPAAHFIPLPLTSLRSPRIIPGQALERPPRSIPPPSSNRSSGDPKATAALMET